MQKKTRKASRKKEQWDKIATYLRLYGNLHNTPEWKYSTPQTLILSQAGGGDITLDDQVFEYNEDKNSKNALFVITGKKTDSHLCFRLDFDIHTNGQLYAVLSSLDGNKSCSNDGSAKSANIVRAAVELAKQKGAHWIDLTDNSKICKDRGFPSISLANYYFLSRAQTWYETIFPFQPDNHEEINDIREQVRNTSWKSMMIALKKRHPSRYSNMLKDMPTSLKHIDTAKPRSIMEVIRSIPYDERCMFLHKYMNSIFDALSIRSLNGQNWWLPLTAEAHHPQPYVELDTVTLEREDYNA
jgi:hypothetical protein